MIIGKASIESNNFKCLVFCIRNIKNILIPNFIKQICSYSFELSSIVSITIPKEIIKIGKDAFQNCRNLQKIEFAPDSKLKIIEDGAFVGTSIEYINIPREVTKIGGNCFLNCSQLKKIEFTNDSKRQFIGNQAFSYTSIESIAIPSKVTNLEDGWCVFASKIKK